MTQTPVETNQLAQFVTSTNISELMKSATGGSTLQVSINDETMIGFFIENCIKFCIGPIHKFWKNKLKDVKQ